MARRYSARQIAGYFLAQQPADGDLISNLKLQKLCYYAQGVGLATRGEPMFDARLEAWMHGPVVPELYRDFRDYGSGAIPPLPDYDPQEIAEEDRSILDDVYNYYSQFSAWRLRQMTHDEAPWRDAYEADRNHVITEDALARFFADQVTEDYRERYAEISGRTAH